MESVAGLLPLILIFGVMYLMLIRPQQKRAREAQEMIARLKVGDPVVTIGGLHGIVEELGDGWVDLLVNPDLVLRYKRTSIGEVLADPDDAADELDLTDDAADEVDAVTTTED